MTYSAGISPRRRAFSAALQASAPVFFGYLSIGVAFGFLLVKAGFSWEWAPVMSLFVFAGAAQYLAVGLLSRGAGPAEIFTAILMVNARHMVYGFSLLERFSPALWGGRISRWVRGYLIFGLTDETYALLTTVTPPAGADERRFDLYLTALNHSYWTLGSLLGALAGCGISWEAPGIQFALTALFTVLLTEQIRALRRPGPFLLGAGAALLFRLLGLESQALLLGILTAAAGCFFLPADRRKPEADR